MRLTPKLIEEVVVEVAGEDVLPLVKRLKNKKNVNKGKVVSLDCNNTFIMGQKRAIAAIGLDDIIIIDSDDALLVCRKDCSQKLKDIVSIVEKKKLSKV